MVYNSAWMRDQQNNRQGRRRSLSYYDNGGPSYLLSYNKHNHLISSVVMVFEYRKPSNSLFFGW